MFSLSYRPFDLNDIKGQKGIINEFKNRSLDKNFPQVMLFEGDSGSGKTTLSFIISAIINCLNPVKIENSYLSPCGKCSSCIDIKDEIFSRDVNFYDASSMSKEEMLDIEKVINISPMYDKQKIIIIDEAQELSKAGKGVFLKLLEKPRKDVFFILCTMNINSLDSAIQSRGLIYSFKKVLSREIAEYLYDILKKEEKEENVPEIFITEGLFTISSYAEGNVRNAIQYLERCITGGFYSKEQILSEFGFITEEDSLELIMKILNQDKTFFKTVSKYDLKKFFYYSWKIILDVNIYRVSGYVDQEWKKNSYNNFLKKEKIKELLKLYNEIYEKVGYYFKDNVFLSKLIEFFDNNQFNPIRIQGRVPVRE